MAHFKCDYTRMKLGSFLSTNTAECIYPQCDSKCIITGLPVTNDLNTNVIIILYLNHIIRKCHIFPSIDGTP